MDYELLARHLEPPVRRWATPGDLARHVNPKTVRTPALDLIDQALVDLMDTPDGRLIVTVAPQEGKSSRISIDLPTWVLTQWPDTRIVTASYGQDLANRNGLAVRRRIQAHPDLGLRIAKDNGAAAEWSIEGHVGGVKSVGIGAGITGFASDLMIIDDPVRSWKEAYSKTYRDSVWDWWQAEANTRLAPGAPAVVVLTRWHHDDLAGRLLTRGEGWKLLNIPAQCVDPVTDPLGRAEGEFMQSARGRTQEQWERRKREAGSRRWASLYQGNPTPDEGNILQPDWWRRWDAAPFVERPDGARIIPDHAGVELCQSWDMAFKGTDSSDFVVGQVWMRRGPRMLLLDQVRGRFTFTQTVDAVRGLTARWPQAVAKLVEDKANGPAVMNALAAEIGGFIPVQPEGSKQARASAISPLVEAGNVELPPTAGHPWVEELIDEATQFPGGAHDDQVDALTQAVHRLGLVPVLSPEVVNAEDLLGDELHLDWMDDSYGGDWLDWMQAHY
ncbi:MULTISPECIES: phage terminase large subunit [Arsenicicoccus]|uniref:phage terminase large subunit n=1 Tax=Arsenicicoccus TaxID=267408 RepID=UPI00257CE649|nr:MULTISPECIES: phage terminase large subunit [Arsenicicoccus]